jgi:hypothetical protein
LPRELLFDSRNEDSQAGCAIDRGKPPAVCARAAVEPRLMQAGIWLSNVPNDICAAGDCEASREVMVSV